MILQVYKKGGEKMKCKDCPYVKNIGNSVYCNHENQMHIIEYFIKNNMLKAPGFLGYCRKGFPIKTSPKWCPLKK